MTFKIEDSIFKKGGSTVRTTGGAISISESKYLTVLKTRFEEIVAEFGGAIFVEELDSNVYTITNSTFANCTASQGGAIHSKANAIVLTKSYFYDNKATSANDGNGNVAIKGHGAAVYYECESTNTICKETVFQNNTFSGNEASLNGGGVSWTGMEPVNITDNYWTKTNKAGYGPKIASYAIGMYATTKAKYQAKELDAETIGISRILTEATLTEVASGQTGKNELYLVLRDKYGQAVLTDSESEATLKGVQNSVSLSGTTVKTAEGGIYVFDSFAVIAQPGTEVSFTVESGGISGTDASSQISVKSSMRDCALGEQYSGSDDSPWDSQCVVCTSGSYSLIANATACTQCVSGAICDGGTVIWPTSGNWRPNTETDQIFSCPRSESCLGHNDKTNPLGECDDGYTSNKCQSCDSNYSRTSKNTCEKCPDDGVNAVRLGGILILVLLIIMLVVRSTLLSAHRPKEIYAVYFKIFLNYMQLVVLTASFKLDWPDEVQELLDTQEQAGSVAEQAFSFDCWLEDTEGDTEVFYQKLIILLILPIIMVSAATLVWSIVAFKKRDWLIMRNQLVTTIIVLFFLAHPIITKAMFSCFACTEIEDGEWWLLEDLSIRCWKDDHLKYALGVALVGVIVWCISAPALALFLLVRKRNQLDETYVKAKYGFLYIGYRKPVFFWEFIILYRKIAIVFISVYLDQFSVSAQALTAMLVLIVAFYIQEHFEPFETDELNSLEKKSIMCSAITIFCGLYFITDSLNSDGRFAFFFVILFANLFFLTFWLMGLIYRLSEKGARVQPLLFRRCCRCWPAIWRRSENIVREQINKGLTVIPFQGNLADLDPDLDKVEDDKDFYMLIAKQKANGVQAIKTGRDHQDTQELADRSLD